MFYYLFDESCAQYLTFAGVVLCFLLTFILFKALKDKLPTDIGRKFAVNAEAAKGKPRGAGIIFVLVYSVCILLFVPFSWEVLCYVVLMILSMLAGFLDDASRIPWGDYKKGFIDLVISFLITLVFVLNNSSTILLVYSNTQVELPMWLYLILGTVLVWASINVTNCTDGVDGLSSSLALISLGGFAVLLGKTEVAEFTEKVLGSNSFTPWVLMLAGCLAAYLLWNAHPSILLMGDAGSRTVGVFFALAAMKSGAPLMFIPLCLIFIVDGGLGLIKIFLGRFFKIKILKNTRTPIHDHFRKIKKWDDCLVVSRFDVVHLIIVFVALFLIK